MKSKKRSGIDVIEQARRRTLELALTCADRQSHRRRWSGQSQGAWRRVRLLSCVHRRSDSGGGSESPEVIVCPQRVESRHKRTVCIGH